MRLCTWNVNGVRSFPKDDFKRTLDQLEADVVALQETKVTRDLLDYAYALPANYNSYFSFCRLKRGGYSGVATFCTEEWTPSHAEEGLANTFGNSESAIGGLHEGIFQEFSKKELEELDSEGRAVLTLHKANDRPDVVIFNVYCPRADPEKPERLSFKLRFYKLLEMRATALMQEGCDVIIMGDVNTSHREIDHCDPYDEFDQIPGRKWMDHILGRKESQRDKTNSDDVEDGEVDWKVHPDCSLKCQGDKFVDSFRKLHPDREKAFTCWNTKLNCRSTNYGTRIDYILLSTNLSGQIRECDIRPDIVGSDHCPVRAELQLLPTDTARTPPPMCSKYFMEYGGQQKKLSEFFAPKRQIDASSGDESKSKRPKLKASSKPKQASLKTFFKTKTHIEEKTPSPSPPPPPSLSVEQPESANLVALTEATSEKRAATALAWKSLFKGPPSAPECPGHKEPAVLRTVKKKGPNMGRQFWSCARGEGKAGDKEARED